MGNAPILDAEQGDSDDVVVQTDVDEGHVSKKTINYNSETSSKTSLSKRRRRKDRPVSKKPKDESSDSDYEKREKEYSSKPPAGLGPGPSSSSFQKEQSIPVSDHKAWWKKFNNDSIIHGTCDFDYLDKQSGMVDLILNGYEKSMNMITNFIDQISKMDEKESIIYNSNIIQLMNNIDDFDGNNILKMNSKSITNMQKFFSFIQLSNYAQKCMKSESEKAKSFNILELVNFYYDFFLTMMAFKMKTVSAVKDSENVDHSSENKQ